MLRTSSPSLPTLPYRMLPLLPPVYLLAWVMEPREAGPPAMEASAACAAADDDDAADAAAAGIIGKPGSIIGLKPAVAPPKSECAAEEGESGDERGANRLAVDYRHHIDKAIRLVIVF